MDKYEKRWLGLKAYEESESEIFFGRKVEAEQICRMVERTTLCTIFAPAGTGKTSLLRAGVFPKLRQRNFFPLRIRLDHQSEDADHCKQIRDTLIVEAEKAGLEVGSVVPAQFDENEETLWEFLHRIELWDKHNQLITPVIVLDQFEEFFTLGQNNPKSLDFLTVLSDLIERRVPQQLRANLNKKGERRKIPTNAQWFKIIISMREDFVAKLDSIRRSMPSIMNNRFPLKSLNGEQALEIIMQPGRDIVEEETARKIVNIAAKNQDESGKAEVALEQLTVEASLLSLLCYELDRQRIKQGEQLINDNQDSLKAASADILRKFYIESFNAIQPKEARDKAFKVVEEQLLTKNGYRRRESLDDAEHGGLSKQACDHLIDQHVLKKIPTGNELEYIELTHDLLTDVVKESRDKRREEEKRQKLEEMRKTQRTRLQLFFMFSIVLLVTTLYSFYLSHRAQQAELKSEQMYYFMTNGLYDQLLSAGRLDMLDPVVGSAYRHFDIEKKGSQTDYSDEKWSSNGEAKYRTLSNIADVLARKGDIGESLEMYQAANKLGEDIARNIANSFESDKDSSRAAFYEKYIDTKISYASLVAKWSDTGLADQLLREATDNLNRLEKNHYLGKRIAIVSAEISLQKGFFDQAIQILDAVMNRSSDESVSTFGKILDAVGYRVQAKAYSGLNIYSKALEASLNSLKILDQLTKKDSTNDEWLYEKLDSLKVQGTLHIAIGDFEGAKDKLIPALAMAKKKNSQLKQLRVDADAHSQWYYLQINITLDLVKLWYRYSASNHLTTDEKKRALKTSFQYWKTLQKFVTDDASVHKADSYLIKKAQLAWLAASCDLLPHYSDEPDKEQVLFRACFSQGQGNNLFELAKAKKNRMFPSIIVLYGDLLKSRIASEKYPRAKEKARLAEIEAAISFFQHVRSEFSDNQLAKKYLIDFYQLLAAEHSKKGKSKLAVAELNNALNLAGSALEAEYTEAFARRKADILILLADEQSRGITESLDKIVNLYNDAYQLYSNLYTTRYGSSETGAFLRLEDRLTAAKVQYKLSKIFRASSGDKDEEAIRSLELASQGGLREASEELALILKETDKEQSSRYEILQNKQRRKQLMVPCLFKDKVIGDRITEVRRLVYAKIWIVGGDITTENSNEGIELEKKRLAYDYGLNLVSEMDTALENRVRVVNSNSESDPELSLAAITDNTFVEQLELASVKERNDTIELRSPVASNYPKTTPTVIGNDILFSWDFQGTANNRRDYRLQVSTDKTFEAESIFIDEEVSGTQFRYDFSVDEDKTGLNRELYWRVRNIAGSPGLNEKDADDSDWSQVRAVEVYQSIWDRILYTGEVRLGVSQFEGDALGVDESDPDKLAKFDGQVLEYIKKQLNEQWKQDRTEIMHLLSPKAAAIEELSYNIASYGWVGMFEAVAKNQVDISASTITRTKDRERLFGIKFSEPYYETRLAILFKKGKLSIESYEDIKNLKLVANKEFRGAKIGRLLVGSNLIEQSFANIDLLAIHVRENDEIDGGITDTTYLMQKFNDKDLIWEQLLGYSKLKSEYFSQLLLDLNKRASNDNGERIQSIIDMQSDYGTAEWEQYAVATSRNDNGVLLKHVNEAILSLRRSGKLKRICEAEKYPYPKRLMGSHQEAEGSRRLASVIPLAPISLGVSDQKIIRPVVIGPSIDFEWKPIKSDQNNRYKLQISENKDFSSLLWSTTSSTNKIVVDPSTIDKFSGVLYWRAKALGHTDEGNDTFPNDGWSNIVEFEYYKSVIDRLKITKKLLVAVNVSNGYSVFRDKNDKLAGFDVDLIGQLAINIASDLDIPKLEVVPVIMSFSEMFSAVQYYQVDMAISGITKKLAREKKYNIKFSHPYTTTRQAAIWSRKDINLSNLLSKKVIVIDSSSAHSLISNLVGRDKDNVIPIKSTPKTYLLEKIESKQADATLLDYPAAIKLIDEFEASESDTSFIVTPLHFKDFALQNESIQEHFIDNYAIPMHESQDEFIGLVNSNLSKIEGLIISIFDKHIKIDESQYPEKPFEFSKVQ